MPGDGSAGSEIGAAEDRGAAQWRVGLFALIGLGSLALAAGYVAFAMRQRQSPPAPLAASSATAVGGASSRAGRCGIGGQAWPAANCTDPHVVFRNVEGAPEEQFGKIALVSLEPLESERFVTPLSCVRIHVAAGKGLCLQLDDADQRKTTVHILDGNLKPRSVLPINGLPSRARVSPDARYGAITVFAVGHSYADGGMSTQTLILDLVRDVVIEDLENFEVVHHGARLDAPDRNFWGVTFARDANHFYATLASGGKTWLLDGDLAARRMRTLRENVECPSLSPDGKRLAFKKRVGGPGAWRLHVLELATLEERPLAEERSIDDQVEWLDDNHVLYKNGPNIYKLDIGAAAHASVFVEEGASPAVVRPSG